MQGLSVLRPCTNLVFFCFPKDKVCPGGKPARLQTRFNSVRSGKLYWKEMMLFHSATCQKNLPRGKHVHCDTQRWLASTFLFWEGKRITPCFTIGGRFFLGWQERGRVLNSLIPNQETFITATADWSTGPQILPLILHLIDSCYTLDVIYLCTTYLNRAFPQATFPWHINISPMFYKPASLPAHQPSALFSFMGWEFY